MSEDAVDYEMMTREELIELLEIRGGMLDRFAERLLRQAELLAKNALKQKKLEDLQAEIDRLKRGDFTPEEFQNLCHHRDEKPGCGRHDFEQGCQQYQQKLFGVTR